MRWLLSIEPITSSTELMRRAKIFSTKLLMNDAATAGKNSGAVKPVTDLKNALGLQGHEDASRVLGAYQSAHPLASPTKSASASGCASAAPQAKTAACASHFASRRHRRTSSERRTPKSYNPRSCLSLFRVSRSRTAEHVSLAGLDPPLNQI